MFFAAVCAVVAGAITGRFAMYPHATATPTPLWKTITSDGGAFTGRVTISGPFRGDLAWRACRALHDLPTPNPPPTPTPTPDQYGNIWMVGEPTPLMISVDRDGIRLWCARGIYLAVWKVDRGQ